MEAILDWATVRRYRTGENPARWKGHLDHLSPAPNKVQKAGHHAALPYNEISTFMKSLRSQEGIAARALEMTILTAVRTGEIIGATWQEIDLEKSIWTIPAERMKVGKEHRVPLSQPALELLRKLKTAETTETLFTPAERTASRFPTWRC